MEETMDSSIGARGSQKDNRFARYCLVSLLLLVARPAWAQFAVGPEFQADAREPGSGHIPGDAGYWIGSSPDGYIFGCWSEDAPGTSQWGLFCRTFSASGPVNDPLELVQTFSQTVFFPTGCADSQGNVYLIWVGSGHLYSSHSPDRGLTFGAPQRADRGGGTVRTAEVQISCDEGGNVYATWQDTREGDSHLYFNSSSDFEETWGASDTRIDVLAGAVQGYRYGPILANDTSGSVYVAWVKSGHLYFNSSHDFGQTWSAADTQLDQFGVADPASSRPSIAADNNGHIYTAWTTGQMYLNKSNDSGVTWLKREKRISDLQSVVAVGGTVTADNSGHVYGLWYYQAQGSFILDVRANSSSDYGETWADNDTPIGTTGVSVHPFIPHLASNQSGGVFAIWLRYLNAGRVRHIYGNASFDYGATWQGENGFQVDSTDPTFDINSHEPFVSGDDLGVGAAMWLDRRDPRQTHMFLNSFGLLP